MMRALGGDIEVMETPEGTVYPGIVDEMAEIVEAIVEETGPFYHGHQESARPSGLPDAG